MKNKLQSFLWIQNICKKFTFKSIYFFWFFSLLFLLLNARNPFSTRTLIPNLEPFPDAIYYTNSAFNLLRGVGFQIGREGRFFTPVVPPLYSVSLVPSFAIFPDVRMFYFSNVVLGIIGFWFFYLIANHLFKKNRLILFFVLMLYVTHFAFFWFPQWAMAENLLIPIFLLGVWLLIKPFQPRDLAYMTLATVALYATKYAAVSFMVMMMFLYTLKLFHLSQHTGSAREHKKYLWQYLSLQFLVGSSYILYELLYKQSNILAGFWSMLTTSGRAVVERVQPTTTSHAEGGFFGVQYAAKSLPQYLRWLIGGSLPVLWVKVAVLPPFFATSSTIGLGYALIEKNWRRFGILAWSLIAAGFAFMMFFYAVDGRYVLPVIPLVLLGFGCFLVGLKKVLLKFQKPWLFIPAFLVMLSLYVVQNFANLKFQMALNLKYAETPWYYVSITELNSFLTSTPLSATSKPVIISALPPFLLDFYLKPDVTLLPLSNYQEFRTKPHEAWGDIDVNNLHQEYLKFLAAGHPIYFAEYGLGNESYLHQAANDLKKAFRVVEVKNGCHDLCKIYQVFPRP